MLSICELFPIEITPEDRTPEEAEVRRGLADARIFIAVGYIAAMESAVATITEERAAEKAISLNVITDNWLNSGGDELLTSAGYQVFVVDGVVTQALSNYDWPPEDTIQDQGPEHLLVNPFGNIEDTQAHPRITFDELRVRVQDAIAGLNPQLPTSEV